MIERYVFVKLEAEHATDAGRAEVRARAQALASIRGVRGFSVGVPADAAALSAWDVSLVVRFESRADVARYLDDPGHEMFYDGFLRPRLAAIKAWNFEV